MIFKKRILTLFVFLKLTIPAHAQEWSDSTRLPFAIAKQKRLSDDDLKDKKEGFYITGVPELSSDPINGFGYGAEGSLFFNGKRSDPFFNYTAYRGRLDVALFNTTNNQREITLTLDIPYLLSSRWRLRVEASYESNPNLLYFGTTEKSLAPLSFYPANDSSQPLVTNASYDDYSNNLDYMQNGYTNHYYNGYMSEEASLDIIGERAYFDSKLRLLGGFEISSFNIRTYDNKSFKDAVDPITGDKTTANNSPTLLSQDFNSGKIPGVGKNIETIIHTGIVYDTRDLEPDPNKGVFAELTNEFSDKIIGSAFNFNKTFAQVKYYKKLFPSFFKKMVFASRIGMGYIAGNAPFFEYQDFGGSEGNVGTLGGPFTLRGYKQSRFMARAMNFANFELRYRFVAFNIFKQHLAFSAVPLFDIGGAWDNLSRIGKYSNYRYSEGMGLRVAWNVNTILRFDYAISKEDKQFFFNFGHAF
jgi:outer membrane protein assembly factor BamA